MQTSNISQHPQTSNNYVSTPQKTITSQNTKHVPKQSTTQKQPANHNTQQISKHPTIVNHNNHTKPLNTNTTSTNTTNTNYYTVKPPIKQIQAIVSSEAIKRVTIT